MVVARRIEPAIYERLAVREGNRFAELRDGVLVEKPPVTVGHTRTIDRFVRELNPQLDPRDHIVSVGGSRLRVGDAYVIPDLVVLPTTLERALFEHDPGQLGVYHDPVPLVVEVWSPSTGGYDVQTKLPLYRARGDREIWFAHPIERTLTAWIREVYGSYGETVHTDGGVASAALPGVRVDLGALFG